ncbi:MAG TPA: peptide ligase PGM1-related protein [Pedococcus sp.]|nr:peptide ligase PGM1-related protein [Pedococcus sp.]
MASLEELQTRLGRVWAMNQPGRTEEHVVVELPSFSLAPSMMAHYRTRLVPLEHRYLVAMLQLADIPRCELVFVTSAHPGERVLDYYAGFLPEQLRHSVRSRMHVVVVPCNEPLPVAVALLQRPEALEQITAIVADRPAMIEPWNVTAAEVAVAERLGLPMNGTAPGLWSLGFKSAARRVFHETGVPTPVGQEDVHDLADVARAVRRIRRAHPGALGVVVKHDNSGAGDGNLVIDLRDAKGNEVPRAALRGRIARAMPDWYRVDLAAGGVVEELVSGSSFASPSAQVDISPEGAVVVLSTHEQVLSGERGQVYTGCRFPAEPAYAAVLARYAQAVGERLAQEGARGRLGVDFVAVRRRRQWDVFAIEVNLRRGGTTHPFTVLRSLVPGRYDVEAGAWVATADDTARFYSATDNMLDPAWQALDPEAAIDAVCSAGLTFNPASGTGVVLHMLSDLAVHGRCGLTAIGVTPGEAERLAEQTRLALDAVSRQRVASGLS